MTRNRYDAAHRVLHQRSTIADRKDVDFCFRIVVAENRREVVIDPICETVEIEYLAGNAVWNERLLAEMDWILT